MSWKYQTLGIKFYWSLRQHMHSDTSLNYKVEHYPLLYLNFFEQNNKIFFLSTWTILIGLG